MLLAHGSIHNIFSVYGYEINKQHVKKEPSGTHARGWSEQGSGLNREDDGHRAKEGVLGRGGQVEKDEGLLARPECSPERG